jgi:DNA-binding transcriptional regulator YhcF (GntR family)
MTTKKKFGVINADVVRDPGLSLRAKAIYALLCTYLDKQRRCYPSIKLLSELSGVNRRTVERSIKELEQKEYVRREGRIFNLK